MRIGELADAAGVNPKTVRYYEEVGLLPEPRREPNGYRRYDEDDLERLAFIRRAQQLELRLDEIREILGLRESRQRPCDYVLQVADERIADLDHRIAAMQGTRDELHSLLARAQRLPSADGSYCGLIEHEPQPTR